MNIKGFTYGYGGRKGDYPSKEAEKSRNLLFSTGVNWICLAFAAEQKTFTSTEIMYDYKKQASDSDIITAINHAHKNGIKVCLKPMVNSADGMWRAYINFPDENMFGEDKYWHLWFDSYTAYLLHYAEIAEETGCEMLCIGCEMTGTERKEDFWRKTISALREVYSGKLVYNTNHGKELTVNWWDAVDYIGTSAYYPVAECGGKSVAEMVEVWNGIKNSIEKVHTKWNKPVIFMEIGCRSALGCATMPWDFTHREFPFSQEEQANFYESCLSVFHDVGWFEGIFWWDWSTKIYDDKQTALKDMGFNIHLKKAEDVIKYWYSK